MGNIVAAIIFRIIQIIWLPLAIVGYVSFVIKLLIFHRKSGVSLTTMASLYTRWMQHMLGTRLDEPAVRLMKVLPNVSYLALFIVSGGTLLGHRVTGYVPEIYRFPYEGDLSMAQEAAVRTTLFDAALTRHLGNIEQLVVLGAGWDTRSYRMPERIRCFEVDAPVTQEAKRMMLEKAGLSVDRITFVPADFMTDDWLEELVNAGFDSDKPAFFLWEGVTMYLDQHAVESTLRKIAGTARGSVVAFDYAHTDLIRGGGIYMRYAKVILNAIGEPWRFGIESSYPARIHVAEFLESYGLTMEEHRNFGQESERKPAMGGFTTAIVGGTS